MPWERQFDVDEVLDKAMHAFWTRGYEATSMQALVKRMGINRGSLYATYRDKHELFLAALRKYTETIHHKRLADFESRYGPLEAIRRAFQAFTPGAAQKGRSPGCFLTNTALELAGHDPDAGRIVARAQRDTEAWFARMVAKGKAAGEVGARVDPEAVARALLASLVGLAVLSRSRPEPGLLDGIVEDAVGRLK